jgi:hypothetical protein
VTTAVKGGASILTLVEPCCAPGCRFPRAGRPWNGHTAAPGRASAEPFGRDGVLCVACAERVRYRHRLGLRGDELWAPPSRGGTSLRRDGWRPAPRLSEAEFDAAKGREIARRAADPEVHWPKPVARRVVLAALAPAEAVRWIVTLWDRRDLSALAAGVVRVKGGATNREEQPCSC